MGLANRKTVSLHVLCTALYSLQKFFHSHSRSLCEAFGTSWAGIIPRWDLTRPQKSKAMAFISLLGGAGPVTHLLLLFLKGPEAGALNTCLFTPFLL